MNHRHSGISFPDQNLDIYTKAPLITALDFSHIDPVAQLENFESSLSDSPAELAQFITTMVFYLMTGLTRQASLLAKKDDAFKKFIQDAIIATGVSETAIVLSLKYIAALKQKLNFAPNGSVEYRIWVTSLMIADTFLNDNSYTCKSWAKVTNLSASECATMRREFLEALDYRICVSERDYAEWLNQLEVFMSKIMFEDETVVSSSSSANPEYSTPKKINQKIKNPAQSSPYSTPVRTRISSLQSSLAMNNQFVSPSHQESVNMSRNYQSPVNQSIAAIQSFSASRDLNYVNTTSQRLATPPVIVHDILAAPSMPSSQLNLHHSGPIFQRQSTSVAHNTHPTLSGNSSIIYSHSIDNTHILHHPSNHQISTGPHITLASHAVPQLPTPLIQTQNYLQTNQNMISPRQIQQSQIIYQAPLSPFAIQGRFSANQLPMLHDAQQPHPSQSLPPGSSSGSHLAQELEYRLLQEHVIESPSKLYQSRQNQE